MVADGEIVVLSCKNVVIGWFSTWWEDRNGAGFVVLDAEKILLRGDAPEVGQLILSRLSSAGCPMQGDGSGASCDETAGSSAQETISIFFDH
jgi:hypothetical protein